MTWLQSLGHKGPVVRPRCIGTERARNKLLFYFTLFHSAHFRKIPEHKISSFSFQWNPSCSMRTESHPARQAEI